MGCGSSTEEKRELDTKVLDRTTHPPAPLMQIDVTGDEGPPNYSAEPLVNRQRRESLTVAPFRRESGARDETGTKSPRRRRTSEVLAASSTLDDFDAASNGPRTPRDAAFGSKTPCSTGFAELEDFAAFAPPLESSFESVVEFVSLIPPRDAHTPYLAPVRCGACQAEIRVKEARFCYHCGNTLMQKKSSVGSSFTCDGMVTMYHYTVKVFRDEASLLGRGSTGCIFKAIDTMNGQPLAVKECDANLDDEVEVMAIRRELRHLSSLRHPHVVDYYGCRVEDSKVMILMERLECGTLEDMIKKFPSGVPETMVQTFARQLLEGVSYVHEAGVTHRDIKPANLLLSSTGAVKLSDFGSAILHSDTNMQAAGSPAYMPPEVLEVLQHKNCALEYGKAHDVWSIGCTVHELLTGAIPWSELGLNPFALVMKLSSLRFHINDGLSPQAKSFLELCLEHDRAKRATAEELLQHPFVEIEQD